MERRLVELAMHGDEEAFDSWSSDSETASTPWRAGSCATRPLPRTRRSRPCLPRGATCRSRDPDRFEAWAYRLVVNACNAEARREGRQRGFLRLLPSDEPTVPDYASRIADQEQLDRALSAQR